MTGNGSKTNRSGVLVAAGLLAALLVACSTPPVASEPTDTSGNTFVPGQPYTPAYVAVVTLDGDTNLDAIAAEMRGVVVPNGRYGSLSTASVRPAAGVGFIGLDSMPPLSTMSSSELAGVDVELNEDRFITSGTLEPVGNSRVWADGNSRVWADGNSRVWADGNSRVWADGNSRVWADGNNRVFEWLPENTDTWKRIELHEGHDEAEELGHGVIVAVIDTGVDTSHPALAGSLSADGYDFVDNDDDPSEVGIHQDAAYGHGTVVAGIVRQIAPRATILPIRALEADGSGDVLNVVRAVYHAIEHGADVINLSLGGPDKSTALEAAIRYADEQGVFVTTTAGNNFSEAGGQDAVNFPANIADQLDFVISVASVDSDDYKSVFSNFGSSVEISAPGQDIFSPYPMSDDSPGLARSSGTSMAAPVVAGALALALGEPEYDVSKRRFAREMFAESNTRIYRGAGSQYRTDRLLGAGRIDIEEFLDEVVD